MNKQPFSRAKLAMMASAVAGWAITPAGAVKDDLALMGPAWSPGSYPGPGKWGKSGVAAAKRAARKRRNQLRARA